MSDYRDELAALRSRKEALEEELMQRDAELDAKADELDAKERELEELRRALREPVTPIESDRRHGAARIVISCFILLALGIGAARTFSEGHVAMGFLLLLISVFLTVLITTLGRK